MLSPRAAAAILDVSPRRVQEFIRDGRIAAENIGTPGRPRYVIQEQEIERFAALSRPNHRPRRTIVKTFSYQPTNAIGATDLNLELTDAQRQNMPTELYGITIYENDRPMAEGAEALYLPGEGRLGIAWGADATWADVRDVESGIEMWLNDGPAWEAAN